MKKIGLAVLVVAVLGVALSATALVHAQAPTPQAPSASAGFGYGMHMSAGAQRARMGSTLQVDGQEGVLHDAIIAIFAEKLGISVADLDARLASGESMSTIAISTGMTIEEFRTLMLDARSQALEEAVTAGTLTREQADWMKTRSAGQMMGAGRGLRNGTGPNANPDCPFNTQVQP